MPHSAPRALARVLLCSAAVLALHPAVPARADVALELGRYSLADRRWTPVSGADAGLAGAGLAVDPLSSMYANPALLSLGGANVRVSGVLVGVNRDDLRASTEEFDEASGFPAVGEVALRHRLKGLTLGAYYAQPHYEREENQYIGFDPAIGGGGDPFMRKNDYTSSTGYGGVAASLRLSNGVVLGAAGEAVFLKESWRSLPQVPANTIPADTLDVDRTATTFGGVLGVAVPVAGKWTIGGAYRFAGSVDYDDGGSDEAPQLGLLGVKYGRTAGSQLYAGFRWLGERTVDLGVAGVPAASASARTEYALAYGYIDPAGQWTARLGYGISPRPADDQLEFTRFGVALGFGGEGLRGTLAYSLESEDRPDGRNSSRDVVALGIELGLQ